MKAHKRDKKIRSEMSCVKAMMCIVDDSFRDLVDPSTDLMRRMVCKDPIVILRMPQADTALKLEAIQRDASLLMLGFAWGFDTEVYFPGSTVWQEYYKDSFELAFQGGQNMTMLLRNTVNHSWEPFQQLSTWPESNLYDHERYFLRHNSYEANLAMVKDLLKNNPNGKRKAPVVCADVSDGLHASLAAALA